MQILMILAALAAGVYGWAVYQGRSQRAAIAEAIQAENAAREAEMVKRIGAPLKVMCEFERRMFADVQAAWAMNGNADDFTADEQAERARLMKVLEADFLAATGLDYDDAYPKFVTALKPGEPTPCRRILRGY